MTGTLISFLYTNTLRVLMNDKKIIEYFGYFILALGLIFYFSWATLYNAFFDVGVYTMTIVLVLFGILTIFLGRSKEQS